VLAQEGNKYCTYFYCDNYGFVPYSAYMSGGRVAVAVWLNLAKCNSSETGSFKAEAKSSDA
jgi:hypothetical protein